jgi:hypothetical protein
LPSPIVDPPPNATHAVRARRLERQNGLLGDGDRRVHGRSGENTNARLQPRRAISAGSCAMAPRPKTMRAGLSVQVKASLIMAVSSSFGSISGIELLSCILARNPASGQAHPPEPPTGVGT